MSLKYNPFQSKLQELDQEYHQMEKWIQICHIGTASELAEVKERLMQECREDEQRLKDMVASGRSQVVSSLASVQLEHFRSTADALEHVTEYFQNAGEVDGDRAESTALYAEFALDHAMHTVRSALLAVCLAIEMQMQIEEVEVKVKETNQEVHE